MIDPANDRHGSSRSLHPHDPTFETVGTVTDSWRVEWGIFGQVNPDHMGLTMTCEVVSSCFGHGGSEGAINTTGGTGFVIRLG